MDLLNLNRRLFLKATGLSAVALAVARPLRGAPAAPRTPNVILVMTDDQGYGDLGCHGNPVIKTPNLDKLYGQSVRLADFHVCPTCSPTRASLMTGRYCNRTGVWHTIMGRSILRKDEVTMADVFAASGYRTGAFGKWHLGDNYPARPQDRGFHETVVHGGGGVGQTPDFWGNDYFDDIYWCNGRPKKYQGYCTDVFFTEGLRFIEENKDRPFFCYIPTNAAHGPYNVAPSYAAPYRGAKIPNPNFYGMIANIDENMGRLVKKLKALDLEKNTILIFMTDNGTAAGFRARRGDRAGYNAGMRGTKGSEYDGGHRVPCFIRWPAGGLGGGVDVKRLAAHIDLLPTLIELCGLKAPAGVAFDGTSIVPLLRGQASSWPDRTLVVDSQRIEHPEKWRKSAVMTDRWRLVNGKELYDMTLDPGQQRDVAAAHPAEIKRLRAEYDRWWASVSERFDEYCPIIVGAPEEDPVRITCHDWHGTSVPWNQRMIRRKPAGANGFWAVEVAAAGRYEFSLRRWPVEKPGPTGAVTARLKIAGVDESKPVSPTTPAITFRVELPAGTTRLQTWFTGEKGETWGAYYVYVKRLSG